MRFEDDVAVVTGGGSGIGEACCVEFANEGAKVVIVDRYLGDATRVADGINANGGDATPYEADVGNETAALGIAEFAAKTYGKITVLVNNAAIRVYGTILDATEESWHWIINTNLLGVAFTSKGVIPKMAEAGGGAIVNVSSAMALIGRDDMPQYDATKGGILSLTRAMAVAHGDAGIRVNAVLPGGTVTQFHIKRAVEEGDDAEAFVKRELSYNPERLGILKRQASPIEIARPILFLASKEASFITGETLIVDGGRHAT